MDQLSLNKGELIFIQHLRKTPRDAFIQPMAAKRRNNIRLEGNKFPEPQAGEGSRRHHKPPPCPAFLQMIQSQDKDWNPEQLEANQRTGSEKFEEHEGERSKIPSEERGPVVLRRGGSFSAWIPLLRDGVDAGDLLLRRLGFLRIIIWAHSIPSRPSKPKSNITFTMHAFSCIFQ